MTDAGILAIDRRLSLRAGPALELECGGMLTPCCAVEGCAMEGYAPGVLLIIIHPFDVIDRMFWRPH